METPYSVTDMVDDNKHGKTYFQSVYTHTHILNKKHLYVKFLVLTITKGLYLNFYIDLF